MTEDTTTETSEETDTTEQAEEQGGKANREAAKYRTALRAAEAERDALKEQLDTLRTNLIEREVEGARLKPAALWAAGIKAEDLLGEDGAPDDDLIAAAITQARETLGIRDLPRAATDGTGGNRGDDIEGDEPDQWTGAFSPTH